MSSSSSFTSLIIGTESNSIINIKETLQVASREQQDFVVIPLFHPRNRRSHISNNNNNEGLITRSDMVLDSNTWISNVVGKISEWIDVDNHSSTIRRTSEEALKQEFSWACHLGLQAVIFPIPNPFAPNYARCLQNLCSPYQYQQIWIKIPIIYPFDYRSNNMNSNQPIEGWKVWDQLRHHTTNNKKINVALELTDELPDDITILEKWCGEPVKAVIIHTRQFLTNQKQFPVLPKNFQIILKYLMKYKLHIILKGRSLHCGGHSLTPYFQYLKHLYTVANNEYNLEKSVGERSCDSYYDTLQAPLQPLMDNLESQTYETFEKDPIKYAQYESAIAKALCIMKQRLEAIKGTLNMTSRIDSDDRTDQTNDSIPLLVDNNSNDDNDNDDCYNSNDITIIVMVVGAGRGPLVAATLSAAFQTNILVKVYAVEKNRNAVVTLRNRCRQESWDNVEVIAMDMRKWNPPVKADIMVSELLGSWGDNELSPECLDGAQDYLQPYGISIPQSYTSYLSPITTSKLWNGACEAFPDNRLKGLETPYVVRIHTASEICPPKSLFTFVHPNYEKPIDNTRFGTLTFISPRDQCIHGFCGTFDSILFDDVMISIAPHSYSKGMFSWFPLFIPLLSPITVRANEIITIHVWRCVDGHRVWYEWCLSSPVVTPIQNPNGRSYWIGL